MNFSSSLLCFSCETSFAVLDQIGLQLKLSSHNYSTVRMDASCSLFKLFLRGNIFRFQTNMSMPILSLR